MTVTSVTKKPVKWQKILTQENVLFVILILIVVTLASLNDSFLTASNLLNMTRYFVEIGLIALPMTLVIITGGIDLSVGSLYGWSVVMLGVAWETWGLPLPAAMGICLLTGVVGGVLNGWLIAEVRVPPLIATLSTMAIYRGLALGISQANPVSGYPDWFQFLGQGSLGPFPTQFVLLVVLNGIVLVFLARTSWGRFIYAIGNNERAALFSGIPVRYLKLAIYLFSGIMSGLAALIFVSRVTTTRADAGMGLELDVIAAVVLGGANTSGGEGSIWGTTLGLVIIALLRNGLSLAGVRGDATVIVIGLVLVSAVFLNRKLRGVEGGAK